MVVLHSTGCPKCKVLKMKLDKSGVEYIENNDVDIMSSKGVTSAPSIEVDGSLLDFSEAIKWVSNK